MSQVRVHNFTVSLDGFGTGEGQSMEAPFGHAQDRLMQWFFGTRTFRAMHGEPGGSTGIDEAFASNWGPGIGAEIMGRNKFGPQRGPWADEEWKGSWGTTRCFTRPSSSLPITPAPRSRWTAARRSTSSTPAPPRPSTRRAGLRAAWTSASAEGRRPSARSSPLTWSITCTSWWRPSCWDEANPLWDGLEGLERRVSTEVVSSPSGVTHLTFTRR